MDRTVELVEVFLVNLPALVAAVAAAVIAWSARQRIREVDNTARHVESVVEQTHAEVLNGRHYTGTR